MIVHTDDMPAVQVPSPEERTPRLPPNYELPAEIMNFEPEFNSLQEVREAPMPDRLKRLIGYADYMNKITVEQIPDLEQMMKEQEFKEVFVELLIVAEHVCPPTQSLAKIYSHFNIAVDLIVRTEVYYPQFLDDAGIPDIDMASDPVDVETYKMFQNDNLEGIIAAEKAGKWRIGMMFSLEESPVPELIDKSTNLLDCAAFYGASKCFEYLVDHGESFTEFTPIFAVIGGKWDIVDTTLLHNDDAFDQHECLIAAILYHRHDFFDWLIDGHCELENTDIYHAIQSRNYLVFYACLLKFKELDETDLDCMIKWENTGLIKLCEEDFGIKI